MEKIRLDRLLVERKLVSSREKARALILAGCVFVGEQRMDKAGVLVSVDAPVRIFGKENVYVSRGGLKLKGALESFNLEIDGWVVLDVGASTGGFTDCLLRAGARKVYALDVGYGQLAWSLRIDPRVVVLDRINIRFYDGRDIEEPLDLVTIDVSFISLKLVIPSICRFIGGGTKILALVKPQFEVGKGKVGKGGVVRDPALLQEVLNDMIVFCGKLGLLCLGSCPSPIKGPAGNQEFFLLFEKRDLKDGC
ncbi:MAG: TlyA family RNA methyltransferase [Syntrophales bacterium]|nr:TlyA family RNA methyltransferase [Syntrophales bacterium]